MVDTFLDMAADSLVPVLSGTHSIAFIAMALSICQTLAQNCCY